MSESDCIFCRIIRGEIPSVKVYEDERVLAFLDLGPVASGHTLIVPKAHHENLLDTPMELLVAVQEAAQKIGRAVMVATGAQGFNVLQNNFAASGQQVFHAHWHVIPRSEGDGLSLWPQGSYSDSRTMGDVAARIAAALAQ